MRKSHIPSTQGRETQIWAEEHWKLVRARQLLAQSRARSASMEERLKANVLSGDLVGLQEDLRICDQSDKFAGKQVRFTGPTLVWEGPALLGRPHTSPRLI